MNLRPIDSRLARLLGFHVAADASGLGNTGWRELVQSSWARPTIGSNDSFVL